MSCQYQKAVRAETDVFLVDKVNAMSAAMLAQMHDTMSELFNPNRKKDAQGNELPFGGKKSHFPWCPGTAKTGNG